MDFQNIMERRILAFGDSNTYGYAPAWDGRYDETTRWPRALERRLGDGWRVIEEGLPGRTAVFQDPVAEGMCGLDYITPCMVSHAPLDTLILMLGTNDAKERYSCSSELVARGILRLAKKALVTDAWREKPDILVVCPFPVDPSYRRLPIYRTLGEGCDRKTAELAEALAPKVLAAGIRFLDAGQIPGMSVHPVDGTHLTAQAHLALADALAEALPHRGQPTVLMGHGAGHSANAVCPAL